MRIIAVACAIVDILLFCKNLFGFGTVYKLSQKCIDWFKYLKIKLIFLSEGVANLVLGWSYVPDVLLVGWSYVPVF